jgi:Cu-processing system ATP-binding protein
MKSIVELNAVTKCYADFTALDNVKLNLKEGEILGLLGHNGAGKTTTMKLILGVISATGGEVSLFGESPTGSHADRLRRNMGYLPENVSFYPQLTGREVLRYFAQLKGVNLAEQQVLLERVGLTQAADKRVKTYSKGMRQRLGLAQALLGQPKLLLFDEPTAGLDPTAVLEFYNMLEELRQQGSTVLISSHVLPGIEKHVDRVAILGKGKLIACGTIETLSDAAKLPLSFHVEGQWENINWQQKLEKHEVTFNHLNGTRIELNAPRHRKLEIMRILLAEHNIKDIEVKHPTLDSLYAYYSQHQVMEKTS